MKNENLGLLEILHPIGVLQLLLFRHQSRRLYAGDTPILITNPTSRHRLSLTLCVAQNPTTDHRSSILISLRMRLLRSDLKVEKERWHLKACEVA
jgi:hypothetical protein